ncbi:MAG: hypothetical protein QOF97_3062, partial [Acidimicrobiaceae bacterium]
VSDRTHSHRDVINASPSAHPIVVRPEGAGHSVVTIFVDDLDDQIAGIAERGIERTKQETYNNGVRKVVYRDPDGNEVGFGPTAMSVTTPV